VSAAATREDKGDRDQQDQCARGHLVHIFPITENASTPCVPG
jgi:hypothetical protein